jgi:hypothetical protein
MLDHRLQNEGPAVQMPPTPTILSESCSYTFSGILINLIGNIFDFNEAVSKNLLIFRSPNFSRKSKNERHVNCKNAAIIKERTLINIIISFNYFFFFLQIKREFFNRS